MNYAQQNRVDRLLNDRDVVRSELRALDHDAETADDADIFVRIRRLEAELKVINAALAEEGIW